MHLLFFSNINSNYYSESSVTLLQKSRFKENFDKYLIFFIKFNISLSVSIILHETSS